MNEDVSHASENEPYVERIQHQLKRWIPKYSQIHPSPEFVFDPDDLIRDPLEITASALDRGFDEPVGGRTAGKAEFDG